MTTPPLVQKLDSNAAVWSYTFNTFQATVYTPAPRAELKSEILNYGFIAPYLLIFSESRLSEQEAVSFAKNNGFEQLASNFAGSVVFIFPSTGDWNTASADILSEIISNSKIHQYYKDGYVKNYNRFSNSVEGYFIRGAIFRINLFGFGESANYIAKNCLRHFEGDGLWGRSDLAPATCILTNLSVTPKVQASDIPVISYGNSADIDTELASKCTYFLAKPAPDFANDFYSFSKKFRRMNGPLQIDPNLESEGLIREPGIATVTTSPDNNGDDKGTQKHDIGYFAFYNKWLLDSRKVPLVLGFHGGGDSCFFFSIMAGWEKICHNNDFLLVTVENHLNSSATEMVELVNQLKQKYPIDEKRIYSTGFSMGGIKTWDLIQEYPDLLAAAAPMEATVDVGENVYFQKTGKEINTAVSVPVFYAAGEVTPLAEMPCQEQKCINRMEYILKLNKTKAEYNIKMEDKDKWQNKFWGINGDETVKDYDATRNATLTMEKFKDINGKFTTVFASISGQGHDCREHTCRHAWDFMKQFSR